MNQELPTDNRQACALDVSVVIPTWNGACWLDQVLTSLKEQSLLPREIVIVDSGSTDSTLAIAQRHGVRLLHIAKEQFDHGGTRTLAAQQAQGDIIVFLTQDAIPADRQALARLVAPFGDDPQLAASYGRQLPNADANPFSAHLRLFNYPEQDSVRSLADRHHLGFKTIFISNSFAAYRRQALEQVGFFPEKLLFGEDTLTVANMLNLGYRVRYVSQAKVFHSHNYTMWQDCRRYFDIGVFHAREWAVLGRFGGPGGAGQRFVRSEISFLFRSKHFILIPLSLVRSTLKLAAYSLGKQHVLLPRSLARSLSMQPLWWD
ncbi:glycosyltransferase family 2 protein [Desulfobulbus alkaliphilus]|uniref:glycosyltransferase family 2 protein n=1 Tax=Desulfobulbus alkaliphilus TaxID=869814 RepID=UPI00196525F4|nr:glycosyltransferase family 2 protein [Desulfobulbus alkaliphilus]MBM9537986.1 glycosyltransferase family 2 protein [Desulfobulbus alkaliphilus]